MINPQSTCFQAAITCFGFLAALCSSNCLMAQERGMSRQEVLEALERGEIALRTIDRPDQADQLRKILNEYMRPRRGQQRKAADAERAAMEREIGMQHVRRMQMALRGLREAEKNEAAELLEHAIHARELRLEGANGPDAREIFKTAPNRGQEIELLLLAAELLQDSGKLDIAHDVRDLGEQFRATLNRNRERSQSQRRKQAQAREQDEAREPAQRRTQRPGRERSASAEETRVLMERLTVQAQEHQQAIEELAQQLRRIAESNQRLQQQLTRVLERDR